MLHLRISLCEKAQKFDSIMKKLIVCEGKAKNQALKAKCKRTYTTFVNCYYVHISNPCQHLFSIFQFHSCRAHRNDMENILPYLTLGLLYALTEPTQSVAITCYIAAILARILHTIVYSLCVAPQPTRAICFAIQYMIMYYFAIAIIMYFA